MCSAPALARALAGASAGCASVRPASTQTPDRQSFSGIRLRSELLRRGDDHRFQITDSNGVIKIAGYRTIRVTNEDTHESRILQLTAMITFEFDGDRVVTTSHGPFLWGFVAGDPVRGLFYTRGFAQEVDEVPGPNPNAFGITTLSFETSGSVENLCETLA